MHHNSQKRINTSKLYQDLRDITLKLQSQKHSSASLQHLCARHTSDSAVQETPKAAWTYLPFHLFVYICRLWPASKLRCINAIALILSTSELQRLINDYPTIFIQQYQ